MTNRENFYVLALNRVLYLSEILYVLGLSLYVVRGGLEAASLVELLLFSQDDPLHV